MAALQLVPARYYARFCEVLKDLGCDCEPLIRAAGVAREELRNPDGRLKMEQVEALLEAAEVATGRSDLALELGRALKLTSHSTVSYGILSSPTVGYALRLVARYFSLILPAFRMRYACDDQTMRVTLVPRWALSRAALTFHLELIAACLHWEVRDLVEGEMPFYDLHLSIESPPHAARYDAFREQRTEFGSRARPGFHMRWPAEMAARPLAQADPMALKQAEARCNEMVDKAKATGNVAAWVGMMLREASGGPPSRAELATSLNLSSRTLDRYLEKEGASFRELNKRARHIRACDLLGEHRLSVTQIAYELGYSDPSNFARAFRQEMGMSPSAWQARASGQSLASHA